MGYICKLLIIKLIYTNTFKKILLKFNLTSLVFRVWLKSECLRSDRYFAQCLVSKAIA